MTNPHIWERKTKKPDNNKRPLPAPKARTCSMCGQQVIPHFCGTATSEGRVKGMVRGEENPDGCSCGFWPCRHYPQANKQTKVKGQS